VLSVPELRGDEDVFTFDVELLEGALDALSYLFLVLVAGWWDISSAQFLRMKEAIAPKLPHHPTAGQSSPTCTGSGCFVFKVKAMARGEVEKLRR
jgi:hypothetical protein